MKFSNEKGGTKSMYRKSKRFIAGFLAFLLVVTMLPTDMLKVYAEETESVETQTDEPQEAESVSEDAVLEDSEVKTEDTETDTSIVDDDKEDDDTLVDSDVEVDSDKTKEEDVEVEEMDSVVEEDVDKTNTSITEKEVIVQEEVNVAADTTGYDLDKTTTWTFSGAYFQEKGIASNVSNMTSEHNLDGITLNSKSTAGKVKFKHTDNQLSINIGGIINIPIQEDTDAIEITLNCATSDKTRGIYIGSGTNRETVKTKPDDKNDTSLAFNNKSYTNATLYKKTDGMFSDVLLIEAYGGECKFTGITLKEYSEKITNPIDISSATVSVTKDGTTDTSATYTGEQFKLKTTLTLNDAEVAKKFYTVEYYRGDKLCTEKDFKDAGVITAKVKNVDGKSTGEVSGTFEITKATLETTDESIILNESSYDTEEKSRELPLAQFVECLSDDDTFEYELSTDTDKGYVAGNVVTDTPTIENSTLKYSLAASKPENVEKTTLVVKVTSDNYEDAYILVEVDIQAKKEITVTLADAEHTYNKAAYGFGDKAEITVTGADLTNEQLTALKEDLSYTFKVKDSVETLTAEPVNAGTYTVTAELSANSTYTLSGEVSAILTINPKPIKIQPTPVTWDKTIDAKKDSVRLEDNKDNKYYNFVAINEETTDIKLETGDNMVTEPILTYYQADGTTEMTDEAWSALQKDDIVVIRASDANAGSNYSISYADGTLTVKESEVTPILALTGNATLLGSDVVADTIEEDLLIKGFLITATKDYPVTLDKTGADRRIKTGGGGNQIYRSIGFTINKAATVDIACSSSSSSADRKLKVTKLNADNKSISECDGVKYTLNKGTETVYSKETQITVVKSGSSSISVKLPEEGTYYISSASGGINFTKVAVTYDTVISDTVKITPTISDSENLLNGGKVYFKSADGDEKEVVAGTELELKKDTTYTLIVKDSTGAASNTLTAKINNSTTYTTPTTDEATVTITITSTGGSTGGETDVSITPSIAATEFAKLGEGEKLYLITGETAQEITANAALTLKVGTTYTAVVKKDNEVVAKWTVKLNDGESFTPSANDTSLTITLEDNSGTNPPLPTKPSKPSPSPANETEFPSTGGSVTLTPQDADIYYILSENGVITNTPDKTSPKYSEPIPVTKETWIKAVVIKDEVSSDVLELHYTVRQKGALAQPKASVATDLPVEKGTKVRLTSEDNADIFYTTDGNEPTAESTKFTEDIVINADITIKAIAIKDTKQSRVATFEYTVKKDTENPPTDNKTDIEIVGLADSYLYTGAAITPDFKVVDNDIRESGKAKELSLGVDYTVKYTNNKKAGKATVTIVGKGNYSGKKVTESFKIEAANKVPDADLIDLKGAKIEKINPQNYTGSPIYPSIKLTPKGKSAVTYTYDPQKGYVKADGGTADINVAVSNNLNKGTATIYVTGKKDAKKKETSAKATFKINPLDISKASVAIDENATYAVAGATPKVTVTYTIGTEVITLKNNTDYTVKYASNKKAGVKGKVTITGKGNYTKKKVEDFSNNINPLDMANTTLVAATANTGLKAGKVKATVVDANGDMLKASQYTVKVYKDSQGESAYTATEALPAAGTSIWVKAEAKDANLKSKSETTMVEFKVGADISKAKVKLNIKSKAYTGVGVKLESKDLTVTIKNGKKEETLKLKPQDPKEVDPAETYDYEIISYSNNVNKGTATAVIRGIGTYSGTKIIKFKIGTKEMKKYTTATN